MSDQDPKGGYGSNWVKWLIIYLVVGGAIYLLVYFLFLRDGGFYG